MKVLVACECSGVVRDAFAACGHDAWSCDLKPTERPGNHYEGDVRDILDAVDWDIIIAHPDCTYLANSGVRWLKQDLTRFEKVMEATKFFSLFLDKKVTVGVCIENPIMHSYGSSLLSRPYTQIIQPYQFGHHDTKATCLWLNGLPKLVPTCVVVPRRNRVRDVNSRDRKHSRARTFQGIANAMAEQWGSLGND